MEPTQLENEHASVLGFLQELRTGHLSALSPYDSAVYGKTIQKIVDNKTAELCRQLKQHSDVTKLSLELQLWWRNHQEADKRHAIEDMNKKKEEQVRKNALSKLTPEEIKALGLK